MAATKHDNKRNEKNICVFASKMYDIHVLLYLWFDVNACVCMSFGLFLVILMCKIRYFSLSVAWLSRLATDTTTKKEINKKKTKLLSFVMMTEWMNEMLNKRFDCGRVIGASYTHILHYTTTPYRNNILACSNSVVSELHCSY